MLLSQLTPKVISPWLINFINVNMKRQCYWIFQHCFIVHYHLCNCKLMYIYCKYKKMCIYVHFTHGVCTLLWFITCIFTFWGGHVSIAKLYNSMPLTVWSHLWSCSLVLWSDISGFKSFHFFLAGLWFDKIYLLRNLAALLTVRFGKWIALTW